MRTITREEAIRAAQVGMTEKVQAGAVVFDDHREVRGYVRGVVIGLAPALAAKLPMPVRWLLSADRVASLLADVFDRVWPSYQTQPSTPEVS
jgi:hypothetical protein